MTLLHLVVYASFVLLGWAAGLLTKKVWPSLPVQTWILEFSLTVILILLFAWPIQRKIGLRPPPPRCPKCAKRRYISIPGGIEWRCANCGQVLSQSWAVDRMVALNDRGEANAEFRLRWPHFLGIWKRTYKL